MGKAGRKRTTDWAIIKEAEIRGAQSPKERMKVLRRWMFP
jgi:hypothetical protein